MLNLRNDDKCQEIFSTTDEPALEEAARAMRAIRGLANDIGPRATLVLAGQNYPDVPLVVAARKLTLEFAAMRAEAKAIAAKAGADRLAESLRLSPYMSAASKRLTEINVAIEKIVQQTMAIQRRILRINDGKAESEAERKAGDLRRLGVSEAEIERMYGEGKSIEELNSEKAALRAEADKIRLFEKTRDLSVLPNHVLKSAVKVRVWNPDKGEAVTVDPCEYKKAE